MAASRSRYVALYGSHGTDWRRTCRERLDRAGIAWHDPSDRRWDAITHENGDRHQELIDELVAKEHAGLRGASCVVFHLEGGESLASRLELGFLAGRGIPAFVHLDPQTRGRNYLWAVVSLYPHLTRCDSLEEACDRAVRWLQAPGDEG